MVYSYQVLYTLARSKSHACREQSIFPSPSKCYEAKVKNRLSTAYSKKAYSTVLQLKLLYQGALATDSRCIFPSQMFIAQLPLDWAKNYIVTLVRSVIEPTHPVHSGGFREESPNVLFWTWDFVHVAPEVAMLGSSTNIEQCIFHCTIPFNSIPYSSSWSSE